jgi:hypothetical protein
MKPFIAVLLLFATIHGAQAAADSIGFDSVKSALMNCDKTATQLLDSTNFQHALSARDKYLLASFAVAHYLGPIGNRSEDDCKYVTRWWLDRAGDLTRRYSISDEKSMNLLAPPLYPPIQIFVEKMGEGMIPDKGRWLFDQLKSVGYDMAKLQPVVGPLYGFTIQNKNRSGKPALASLSLLYFSAPKGWGCNSFELGSDDKTISMRFARLLILALTEANYNLQDNDGDTVLTLAARGGDGTYSCEKFISYLLEHGSDKTHRDSSGRSAFDYAMQSGDMKSAMLLKQ